MENVLSTWYDTLKRNRATEMIQNDFLSNYGLPKMKHDSICNF